MSRLRPWSVLWLLLVVGQVGRAEELQRVGEARLQVLLWPVYTSRLYSEDGDYRRGQRPLRLEIEYLRNIRSEALVERTAEEWQSQQLTHQNQQLWLNLLRTLWPDIRKGDRLARWADR